ncbi:DUF2508 family protein [Paenibacillus xerothermodurans]|nr:DUF2508 family protein [Paenibacillus xerothermodurans]
MKLWSRRTGEEKQQAQLLENEQQQLMQEIRQAHADWVLAYKRLDYVIEKEQIDYAVYALEAAEKRFEMLLKQAKQMKLSGVDVPRGRVMHG